MTILLVTGGARSGKSLHAETRVLGMSGRPVYIATATPWDDEMRARIAAHRARRTGWTEVEEPLDLCAALTASDGGGARLVDCLTLWLSNVMHAKRDWRVEAEGLIRTLARQVSPVVLVTNEVGMGIVPDNALARAFRDAQGTVNQMVARVATGVDLVVSGPADEGEMMFYDLDGLLARDWPQPDAGAAARAAARQVQLTKPVGSLGRLEDLAVFMAGWQGRDRPRLDCAQVVVFAGNHGICNRGVNPFPQSVTAQMVANFAAGGAAINQLSRAAGAELSVVALDLERPTGDFTQGPAMTAAEVLDAMRRGAEAVDPAADILVLGEMGIGNSTIAAALACAAFGGTGADWVGPGTGSDADGLALKARVVDEGMALHTDLLSQPFGALMAFGGREQAAICGAVLAARAARIPVILDGFVCSAAVAGLPLDHCLIGHSSAEPGHARLCAALGKVPLLDLGMRLGEGSGAAVALMVVRAALAMHDGMATFSEAGIG